MFEDHNNKTIQISSCSFHFLYMGATSSPRLLIYFKYKSHIEEKKLTVEEGKMDMMVTQSKEKCNKPFRIFLNLYVHYDISISFLGHLTNVEDLEQEKVLCTGTFQGFLLAFKNTFFEKLPKTDSIRFSCAFLSCMCRKKIIPNVTNYFFTSQSFCVTL